MFHIEWWRKHAISMDVMRFLTSVLFSPLLHIMQDLGIEKKSSDLYVPDDTNSSASGWNSTASDIMVDEEAPLIPSSRVSHLGRSQLGSHSE